MLCIKLGGRQLIAEKDERITLAGGKGSFTVKICKNYVLRVMINRFDLSYLDSISNFE